MKTLEERVDAIERWIEQYEIAEAEWLKENPNEIVLMPAAEFFRDRTKDN